MYSEYICLLRTKLTNITKRLLLFSRNLHMSFAPSHRPCSSVLNNTLLALVASLYNLSVSVTQDHSICFKPGQARSTTYDTQNTNYEVGQFRACSTLHQWTSVRSRPAK